MNLRNLGESPFVSGHDRVPGNPLGRVLCRNRCKINAGFSSEELLAA